ncbi:hypothetical protein A2U01_0073726, partial [Trifolium medium]|nr:hypothetical protein [Trifolium medium]
RDGQSTTKNWTHSNNQVDIAPRFGRCVVEALEVRAHIRSQVTLVELYGLESVGIHNVTRAARIDEDSAKLKGGHVYPDEERDVGIR